MEESKEIFNKLNTIITEIESIYGLYQLSEDGNILAQNSIKIVIDYVKQRLSNSQRETFHKTNAAIGKYIVLLAYLDLSLSYKNCILLDFSQYSNSLAMGEIFSSFLLEADLDKDVLSSISQIIEQLSQIENLSNDFKDSSAYRYTRVFIIMVLYSNFVNASIVADFLYSQLNVK